MQLATWTNQIPPGEKFYSKMSFKVVWVLTVENLYISTSPFTTYHLPAIWPKWRGMLGGVKVTLSSPHSCTNCHALQLFCCHWSCYTAQSGWKRTASKLKLHLKSTARWWKPRHNLGVPPTGQWPQTHVKTGYAMIMQANIKLLPKSLTPNLCCMLKNRVYA